MKIGKFIVSERKKRGLSQRQLAVAAHINNATISRIESGIVTPNAHTVSKLARALAIPEYDLFMHMSRAFEEPMRRLPILGRITAGMPIEALEDVQSYEELPREYSKSGEYFGLVVRGNSMEPFIKESDVVIVRRQPDVENGDTAIVMIGSGDATVKKVKKNPDGIMLVPNNSDYDPIFYTWDDVQSLPVMVLGKVIELRRRF